MSPAIDRRHFLEVAAMSVAAAHLRGIGSITTGVSPTRKEDSMATMTPPSVPVQGTRPEVASDEIRPFHVNYPESELTDLRRRIKATKWPEVETVSDASQGVQLATAQALAAYWGAHHDWRKCEARLNAVPNFITQIDGLDFHFIHVRSKHENALPSIVTHGWPGSSSSS